MNSHSDNFPIQTMPALWKPTFSDFMSSLTFRFKKNSFPIAFKTRSTDFSSDYFYISFTNIPHAHMYRAAISLQFAVWESSRQNMFLKRALLESASNNYEYLTVGGCFFEYKTEGYRRTTLTDYPQLYSINSFASSYPRIVSWIVDYCFTNGKVVPFVF